MIFKKQKQIFFHVKNLITAGMLLALSAILLTFYFRNPENELQQRLKKVLLGLTTIDKKYEINYPRVAVGYGACEDIVFNAKDVLHFGEFSNNNLEEVINSYQQLLSSFAYYFKYGAAAERFTPNVTLFSELVDIAVNLKSSRVTIGGNAASIAKRFALDGFDVLLGSTISSNLQKLLPESIKVAGEITNSNDIHLIFEYKTKDQWGTYTAPRANRFILHHDYHNPRLNSLESFNEHLKDFNPHLLVISGLQVMDHYPLSRIFREERLSRISQQMKSQSEFTKIHFEMASITEINFLTELLDLIIPFADSLGMNEQELANIYSFLRYNTITLAADSNPRISKTLDMMRQIYSILQDSRNATQQSRPLTRLHVHTLAYQLIMVCKDSNWKNTFEAAARASLVANTYVCGTPEVDINKAILVMDESFMVSSIPGSRRIYLNDQKPVACWDENLYYICIAPNLVCTNAKQTAGCGDNISAAGLGVQL